MKVQNDSPFSSANAGHWFSTGFSKPQRALPWHAHGYHEGGCIANTTKS